MGEFPSVGRVLIKPGMGNEEMRNGKRGNGEMRKWGNEEIAEYQACKSFQVELHTRH